MSKPAVSPFRAEVSQVLRLVVGSLYSNQEIFLRELLSNASDALDRVRFRAIGDPELLAEGELLRVRIIPDEKAGTLTIWDNGVGMSDEELAQNLGTIAWSGSKDFLDKLEKAEGAERLQLIGQFGVGFYSAFLVADLVEVTSRAAGSDQAFVWVSTGQEGFSIAPSERPSRGTSVTLHLKADHKEYADGFRLRELVRRYSDYLPYPIELEKKTDAAEPEFEVINRASALWQRSPKEIEKAQYEEFYKHLTHDWEAPLAWRHFRIEGTQLFVGLLFLPKRAPLDLFDQKPRHGVRLHVKRVFVMDDCEELVPRWLRFVRGVVDSEDLPLNVSREVLQDSKIVRVIKKQLVTQTLDMLEDLAKERADDYASFWKESGSVLKEGFHFDPEYKQRLAALVRYESSKREGLVSLAQYVEAMPDGQPAIYYAEGASKKLLESGPHVEALRKRGYELLYMTDSVDPFVVSVLAEFQGKKLVSALGAELDLGESETEKAEAALASKENASQDVVEHIKRVLGERVADVRASKRLTDSPACLVVGEGALPPHLERLMRMQKLDLPANKRILEVNLGHPLLGSLSRLAEDPESEFSEWVELLYDQALLAEGSPIEDPAKFARRVAELMTSAAREKLSSENAS